MTPRHDKSPNPSIVFLKAWLRSPLKVGAIAPSGGPLARAMARAVPKGSTLPVVELGGGTGEVTKALLKVLPAERLLVVERDPALYGLLRRRYPDVAVIHGDAVHLRRLLRERGIERVAAAVSCLPLVAMSKRVQQAILRETIAVLDDGAPLIQFTYSLFSPVSRRDLGLVGRPVARVLQNVPPASVWVYRRRAEAEGEERRRAAG